MSYGEGTPTLALKRAHCHATIHSKAKTETNTGRRFAQNNQLKIQATNPNRTTPATSTTREPPPRTKNKVVRALQNPGAHIPYRESTLTSVLRTSLGRECRPVFVVTLSVDVDDLAETVASCR